MTVRPEFTVTDLAERSGPRPGEGLAAGEPRGGADDAPDVDQLALDLTLPEPSGGWAYPTIEGAFNRDALAALSSWDRWPHGRLLVVGGAGTGRTHLLRRWAALSQGRHVRAADLSGADPFELARSPLAIDDVDDPATDEIALFHLLNATAGTGSPLLMASRVAPGPSTFGLPDLLSRLKAVPTVNVGHPTDGALRCFALAVAARRQIRLDALTVDYLLARIDRSFGALEAWIERLDRESLRRARPITRLLAAELIQADAMADAPTVGEEGGAEAKRAAQVFG